MTIQELREGITATHFVDKMMPPDVVIELRRNLIADYLKDKTIIPEEAYLLIEPYRRELYIRVFTLEERLRQDAETKKSKVRVTEKKNMERINGTGLVNFFKYRGFDEELFLESLKRELTEDERYSLLKSWISSLLYSKEWESGYFIDSDIWIAIEEKVPDLVKRLKEESDEMYKESYEFAVALERRKIHDEMLTSLAKLSEADRKKVVAINYNNRRITVGE